MKISNAAIALTRTDPLQRTVSRMCATQMCCGISGCDALTKSQSASLSEGALESAHTVAQLDESQLDEAR